MITPGQCRAARAWLNIHQQQLADLAGVSMTMIKDFEGEKRNPTRNNVAALRRAFESEGLEFTEDAIRLATKTDLGPGENRK